MQDRETGTLWSHVSGEALSGPLAGSVLEQVPMVQTTWREWVAVHPRTLVLRKEEAVSGSRYADYFADSSRNGIFPLSAPLKRLPGKTLIQGVALGPAAVAIVDTTLEVGREFNVQLAEARVTVARGEDGGVRAWRKTEAGREELVVRRAYWFAWVAFYPRSEVVGANAGN